MPQKIVQFCRPIYAIGNVDGIVDELKVDTGNYLESLLKQFEDKIEHILIDAVIIKEIPQCHFSELELWFKITIIGSSLNLPLNAIESCSKFKKLTISE